jgi:hypothetical protein
MKVSTAVHRLVTEAVQPLLPAKYRKWPVSVT